MARKRIHDADEREEEETLYNDEEEDEEDEDEEEEEEERPRKRKANPFIDEMAMVDDDEEEEEEDDEYAKEDGFIEEETDDIPSAAKHGRHLDLDRRRREVEEVDYEQVTARLRKKYGSRKSQAFKVAEEVPQLLLPSMQDPKLWVVKCKHGKEKDVIFGLMKRYFDRQYSDSPLEAFSAFAKDSLKGYVYIEARRQAHVVKALSNMPNIFHSTLNLVPVKEMIDCINIPKKKANLARGTWVRVKRGKYAGDLGQVLEVEDTKDMAVIKLVPRLDLDGQDDVPGPKNTTRPPQRLFNPENLGSRFHRDLRSSGKYWYLKNDVYHESYLEKSMKIATLQIDDVNPTVDELRKFKSGGDLNNDSDMSMDISSLVAQAVNNAKASLLYQSGDTVKVIGGDMINCLGTVEKVDDSFVTVSLNIDGKKKSVTLAPKLLRKHFNEGDQVKVINGRHQDESGMIINIDKELVTLLSDANQKEITVFSKDLRETVEVSHGRTSIGNYELHDLVQLDAHTVGVIIKVDQDNFKVMTENGEIRTTEPHQVTKARGNKWAKDSRGNSVQLHDKVYDSNKRSCEVLHIHRYLVFLYSRDESKDYGISVSKSREITKEVVNNQSSMYNREAPQQQPFGNPPSRGGFDSRGRGARGGLYGRGRGGRDNLTAKTVLISKGPHKGYKGIVKDSTDTEARVELHTNSKLITVSKDKLTLLNAQGDTIGPVADNDSHFQNTRNPFPSSATPRHYGDGARTPMHSGAKTPAWNSSARTPNPYANDGGRTPAWDIGSKTPNPYADKDGSKTPAWDIGSKTPNPYNNSRYKTPAWESGSKTPTWNPETPRWGSDSSRTPGYSSSGNKTPIHSSRYEDSESVGNSRTPSQNAFPSTTTATHDGAETSTAYPDGPYDMETPYAAAQTPYVAAQTPYVAAQTPYVAAQTPYVAAQTPFGTAQTPFNGPQTPYNIQTPFGGAPTPGARPGVATPGSYLPATPGAYPHASNMDDDDELNENWPIEDIEVKTKSSAAKTSSGQEGYITSVNFEKRMCEVMMYETREQIELSFDALEPVMPKKKDNIKVFSGKHRGKLGSLFGVDGHDSIVQFNGSRGFELMKMNSVGKKNREDRS